jgi:hypothetical protein
MLRLVGTENGNIWVADEVCELAGGKVVVVDSCQDFVCSRNKQGDSHRFSSSLGAQSERNDA